MSKGLTKATAIAAAVLGLSVAQVSAQEYPVDTITIISHSSPGGGSDILSRDLAKFLGPALGVKVVVENVTGGSGANAMAATKAAPADGSTFYATTPTYIYTSLLSEPEATYKDLDPVVNLFADPEVVFTASNSGIETFEQAIEAAKAGKVSWGAANPASLERLALERLKKLADVDASIVTFEGGGDAMLNVLNGTLQIGVGEIQEMRSQLEAGELRLLAVLRDERLENYPDLPTVKELGYDLSVRKFRGFAAPKGLPPEVIAAWEKAIPAILEDPEYQKVYQASSLLPDFLNHDQYGKFIDQFAVETEGFLKDVGALN